MQNIFTVDQVKPFLAYKDIAAKIVTLTAFTPDEYHSISFDKIWQQCEHSTGKDAVFFVNVLRNKIACQTRRRTGTHMWAHPETIALRDRQIQEHHSDIVWYHKNYTLNTIADESLPVNEVRLALFHDGGTYVDGPLQFVDKKVYRNVNHLAYFVRGTIRG